MKRFIEMLWGWEKMLNNEPQHSRVVFIVTASCSLGFLKGQLGYLQSHEFDVTVISSGGLEQESARHEGASVFTVPMHREISLSKDVLSLYRLWRILRRIRPNLTIVGTPKAGLLGGVAAVLAGVPKRIYVLHGLRLETSVGWLRSILIGCEWTACRCAHSVRCVSPSLMTRVTELGIARANKCHVVGKGTSNGIDTEHWQRTPQAAVLAWQMREQLGIPREAPVVGFMGRFTRDKGIVELYEAFTRLRSSYPHLRLLLVGDFEEGDPVSATVRARIEADPAVLRTGFVVNVAPYLWNMDMLVLPTYREGFPGVVLEAQAASIAVITTNATGAIDAILNGKTGLQVPVGDVDALATAVGHLLANPKLRNRMGQSGCRWVQQNFERETVWNNLIVDYRFILDTAA
jgi:glycosyltransferase involved in cell wall biosynthesis